MSEKIHLRSLQLTDLTFLDQLENNPDYWHLSDTEEPYSKELLTEYILAASKPIKEVGQERFVIALGDETPVGFIDLFDFNYLHKRAGIGLIIEKQYREKGYARQSIELVIQYAKNKLKIHQLYANILEDNTSSIALFEKLDFKKTGVKKNWHFCNGAFKDEYLYQYIIP